MAINKYALIRYQALDRCFRNPGRNYYFEDLLEACNAAIFEYDENSEGIKRRQLFDDINFMESDAGYGIELDKIRDGKRVYYRYTDTNYSINNQPLNETETNQIKSALMILSRFKGMPQFEWVSEISAKISSGLELEEGLNEIISFDSNEYLKGIDLLGDLFNAIHYKKTLEIKYKPFKGEKEYVFEIHSYYLKQFNNRWFLFGLNKELDKISNLALDRIVELKEIKRKYIPSKKIDFTEYFEDIIGVTKPDGAKITKIELLFSPSEAPYIITKPIHGSQKKIKLNENGLLISIEVVPNYELEKLILSFGENLKVVGPKVFRDKLVKRLEAVAKIYS
jgi:predicted DNA-binding transcriptional regulator YafY